MRRSLLLLQILLCVITPLFCFAQVKEVNIGVNGLTCSACTRSVEMQLRKLGFVQEVAMNLEHTNGKITFKPGAKVDFGKIAQAVYDAGFSVRELQAVVNADLPGSGNCMSFSGDTFVILDGKDYKGGQDLPVRFIGEKYMLKKDYKAWKPRMKINCKQTTGNVYYITVQS